ncbi:beta-galactosidase [bacterium]|nr:beta-galactosidase [bacterium]
MRHLLKSEYIPFGTQYYRAPSPSPADWENDLRNIAALGFNTAKFWVQWRWNHPAEDEFYFGDIDRLMDIAHRNKLRVMLNTIFDVAPAWIYRKYPDASMLTLDGRRIGPQTQPHRQIGGLGLCFNHAEAMEHFFHFLRETIKRYKDHPALEMWNVGSEPELTSSMAEMRLYADNAGQMGDMLCCCERCQFSFKKWLGTKYGNIEQLNVAWNRNYRSFDDIEIPKTRNTFNDMIDWRMFFVHTLGENVKRRFEVAKAEDQGKHPLLCHHVFIQGFPVTSTANDPWNVGQYGDLHGITQMDDPMMVDVVRSCAKSKPVMCAEMLMLFGYTLDLPKPIDMNDIKRFVFTGIAANLKGCIFWQYRPEILGREAPAWGLTYLDSSPTPWLQSFAEVNGVVQKNAAFLLDAAPQKAEIALLYNPENQIFAWAATGTEKTATNSLLGVHQALYRRNFKIDLIHPNELDRDILQNYKVVYVPFPYYLSEKICQALAAWVHSGGILIGESYFAGWYVERGHHQTTVPGYGLHKIFKARQGVVAPPDENGKIEIEMVRDLGFIKKGEKAYGATVKEAFFIEGAEVLARFSAGEPAITCADYGKGKAILIGSYLGLPYYQNGCEANAGLIASLVDFAATIERPQVLGEARIRADILTAPNQQAMIITQNLEPAAVAASIYLPMQASNELTEQFSNERLTVKPYQHGAMITLALAPKEVKVFRA